MAQRMTQREYEDFLLDRARTATLATVRTDGRPHAAPVWFDLDGDNLVFTTGETTVKGRNMLRDSRVSLCIDEQEPPFHFAIVEGTAELTADDPDLLHWATRIGGRYMGADRAEEYGRRNAVTGELLVRVTPTKSSPSKTSRTERRRRRLSVRRPVGRLVSTLQAYAFRFQHASGF